MHGIILRAASSLCESRLALGFSFCCLCVMQLRLARLQCLLCPLQIRLETASLTRLIHIAVFCP